MPFRYFQSWLYLWKIHIAVVSLSLSSCSGKPNFYPVKSCTDMKLKDIPIDVFQECSRTNTAIHCLPDENNNLGLSCFQVTWISEDKCPSYNSYQGNMDEKDCSTDHNGKCPGALYKSPLSVNYTGCYIKELIPPPTTKPSMTTMTTEIMTTMTTKTPTTCKNSSSGCLNNGNMTQTDQVSVSEAQCGNGWMIAFVTFIIPGVLAIIFVAIILKSPFFPHFKERIRQVFFPDQQYQNGSPPPLERDAMLETRNGGNA